MASEYVTGREHSPGAREDEQTGVPGAAHAVRRSDADGAPPWTAVCGAVVNHVQGVWTPGEGRSTTPCEECVRQTGA